MGVQEIVDSIPTIASGDPPNGDLLRTELVNGIVGFIPGNTSVVGVGAGAVLQVDPVDAVLGAVRQAYIYGPDGGTFIYDPLDETTAHDGIFCLVLIGGRRYLRSIYDPIINASLGYFATGTDASHLSGTVASARIAGPYTGITGVGTLDAGVWHGTKIGVLYGGTNADLSATGGASQVLKQTSVGGAITVAQLVAADISGLGALATLSAVTVSQISDASANGRSLITAANYAAMKTLLAIASGDVSGLGYFATGADAANLTGTVATARIAGSYTGITAVGTLAAGVWHGTKIGVLYGGTNADLSATGGASQVLKQTSVGGAITVGQLNSYDLIGVNIHSITSVVNLNAGNTDTAFPINLPVGSTRFLIQSAVITSPSNTMATATAGLFTAAAGGGVAIVTAASTVALSSTAENTNNNARAMTVNNTNTQSYNVATLYWRVATAEGAAATASVTISYRPMP